MALQTFALNTGRINKFKGAILAHAVPQKFSSALAVKSRCPRTSRTYVARRFCPTVQRPRTATPSTAFPGRQQPTAQRPSPISTLVAEGVTPTPDSTSRRWTRP